ncbi:TonB family protein [Agrobacterium vitis]|uniref:energy transducer TonB n=1 Tax=Agrobacterium vitis TaxID=373 RepID=UPI0012E950FF|nr:energy transducer TonB [Agrobacterium vitis]MVA73860.1 TonB family protein [Agrobacterium vitis]
MSRQADPTGRRSSALDWLLWCTAGTLVFAAHAGAVVLMLQQPEEPLADGAPPAAIMIELAPEPVASKVEENQITPDQQDAEEVKSEAVQKPPQPVEPPPVPQPPEVQPPEPTPPEKVEETPPPPPDVAEVQPEPPPEPEPKPVEEPTLEEQVTKELENVEVPLPVTRPVQKPVETADTTPVKKKQPKAAPQPQAQKAQREAQAEVTQSDRTAASTTSSGLFSSSVSPQKWQARLAAYLERRKRYPSEARANKEEGTAYARFQIDDSGNVLSVSISRSSGFPNLDQATVDAIKRSSPVPAPPPGVSKTITVPFRFNLK